MAEKSKNFSPLLRIVEKSYFYYKISKFDTPKQIQNFKDFHVFSNFSGFWGDNSGKITTRSRQQIWLFLRKIATFPIEAKQVFKKVCKRFRWLGFGTLQGLINGKSHQFPNFYYLFYKNIKNFALARSRFVDTVVYLMWILHRFFNFPINLF